MIRANRRLLQGVGDEEEEEDEGRLPSGEYQVHLQQAQQEKDGWADVYSPVLELI